MQNNAPLKTKRIISQSQSFSIVTKTMHSNRNDKGSCFLFVMSFQPFEFAFSRGCKEMKRFLRNLLSIL